MTETLVGKPSIGRIVHYFPNDEEKADNNLTSPIAAVVVAVWSATCVNLKLLQDGPADAWKTSVLLRDEDNPVCRWDWPART